MRVKPEKREVVKPIGWEEVMVVIFLANRTMRGTG